MSDNKKYYYMRLKDNFFDSEELRILESQKNGYVYSNILLKMYLRSLKREGCLMFNETIPYDAALLSQVIGHKKKHIEDALEWCKKLNLIEVLDSGAIYMLNIQEYIGNSSSEADRIRKYRKTIEHEKNPKCTNVQDMYEQMYDKPTPETEIEIEKEKKTDTETNIEQSSVSASASLFCIEELCEIVDKNKVNLSRAGIEKFFDEMQASGWKLYGKPVLKENIVRSLRGYAKYNEKYHLDEILNGTEWEANVVYDSGVCGGSDVEISSGYYGITFVRVETEDELFDKLKQNSNLKCCFSSCCKSWYIEFDEMDDVDEIEDDNLGWEKVYTRKITRSHFEYLRNKNQNIEGIIDAHDSNYLWIRPKDDKEVLSDEDWEWQ